MSSIYFVFICVQACLLQDVYSQCFASPGLTPGLAGRGRVGPLAGPVGAGLGCGKLGLAAPGPATPGFAAPGLGWGGIAAPLAAPLATPLATPLAAPGLVRGASCSCLRRHQYR